MTQVTIHVTILYYEIMKGFFYRIYIELPYWSEIGQMESGRNGNAMVAANLAADCAAIGVGSYQVIEFI